MCTTAITSGQNRRIPKILDDYGHFYVMNFYKTMQVNSDSTIRKLLICSRHHFKYLWNLSLLSAQATATIYGLKPINLS